MQKDYLLVGNWTQKSIWLPPIDGLCVLYINNDRTGELKQMKHNVDCMKQNNHVNLTLN